MKINYVWISDAWISLEKGRGYIKPKFLKESEL